MKLSALFFFVLCLLKTPSLGAQGELSPRYNWERWQLHFDAGIATKARLVSESSKEKKYFVSGPMFEYGIEKGFVVKDNWYLSADLIWPVFYPDSFEHTSIDPWKIWVIPVLHLQLGYIFSDGSLLTVGSTYFWGIMSSYRKPIDSNWYAEFKFVQWLDEPWDGNLPFHQAIHRNFLTAGIGYSF